MQIRPLAAPLGAMVTGVRNIGEVAQHFDEVLAALRQHLLLVFRGQVMPSDAELVEFGMLFGDSDTVYGTDYGDTSDRSHRGVPGHPEIVLLSNEVDDAGRPVGVPSHGTDELIWHFDGAYRPVQPNRGVINGVKIPEHGGGETSFANMHAAWEALPPGLRSEVAALQVVNVGKGDAVRSGVSVQPAARPHPDTGRWHLNISHRFSRALQGVDPEGGRLLLDRLLAHATEPRFVYDHVWEPGDILLHDALATIHRRARFDPNDTRVVRTVSIVPRHTAALLASLNER